MTRGRNVRGHVTAMRKPTLIIIVVSILTFATLAFLVVLGRPASAESPKLTFVGYINDAKSSNWTRVARFTLANEGSSSILRGSNHRLAIETDHGTQVTWDSKVTVLPGHSCVIEMPCVKGFMLWMNTWRCSVEFERDDFRHRVSTWLVGHQDLAKLVPPRWRKPEVEKVFSEKVKGLNKEDIMW
jgi:hypothetical protein